jgi:hypothetical protein
VDAVVAVDGPVHRAEPEHVVHRRMQPCLQPVGADGKRPRERNLEANPMSETEPDLDTNMPDLAAGPARLRDIRRQAGDGLDAPMATLHQQVEKPRVNLGTGPPGRAD